MVVRWLSEGSSTMAWGGIFSEEKRLVIQANLFYRLDFYELLAKKHGGAVLLGNLGDALGVAVPVASDT